MFGFQKAWGKIRGKKIERKNRMLEKMNTNKK